MAHERSATGRSSSRPSADEVERARRPDDDGFAAAFGRAIRDRGVSLDWLHDRLETLGTPVSTATLSYWRSGRRQPERQSSYDALAGIESLLEVPAGSLAALVGPSRRPGPRRERVALADLMPDPAAAARLLAELGLGDDYGLSDTTRHHVVEVDQDGRQTTVAVRKVIIATRDGADRFPVLGSARDAVSRPPVLIARHGCRVGRVVQQLEDRIFGWELVLERPLRVGETALTDHLLQFPADRPPSSFFEIFLPERTAEAAVWVNFHPERLPRTAELYTEFRGTPPTSTAVDLAGSTSVHILRQRGGPGRMGVRWTW